MPEIRIEKPKTVAIVGGANAAAMGAIHLAEFASKVYLIYRGKPFIPDKSFYPLNSS